MLSHKNAKPRVGLLMEKFVSDVFLSNRDYFQGRQSFSLSMLQLIESLPSRAALQHALLSFENYPLLQSLREQVSSFNYDDIDLLHKQVEVLLHEVFKRLDINFNLKEVVKPGVDIQKTQLKLSAILLHELLVTCSLAKEKMEIIAWFLYYPTESETAKKKCIGQQKKVNINRAIRHFLPPIYEAITELDTVKINHHIILFTNYFKALKSDQEVTFDLVFLSSLLRKIYDELKDIADMDILPGEDKLAALKQSTLVKLYIQILTVLNELFKDPENPELNSLYFYQQAFVIARVVKNADLIAHLAELFKNLELLCGVTGLIEVMIITDSKWVNESSFFAEIAKLQKHPLQHELRNITNIVNQGIDTKWLLKFVTLAKRTDANILPIPHTFLNFIKTHIENDAYLKRFPLVRSSKARRAAREKRDAAALSFQFGGKEEKVQDLSATNTKCNP